MHASHKGLVFAVLPLLLLIAACGSKPTEPATETKPGEAGKQPGLVERVMGTPVTIPAGTTLTIRLNQAVGSRISNSGDSFSGVVVQPVSVGGKVVIPEGAEASGTVAEAAPRGKFKGGARLRLALTSVNVDGKSVPVEATATRAMKGKGKRTAAMIGGGAGLGALIGGIAGGGKGAAIGAVAGGGAGTAGAAFTGNKDIVLPAESAVSFRLAQAVEVRK